jgi:hypothetical protein
MFDKDTWFYIGGCILIFTLVVIHLCQIMNNL